jgi:hypothetical protein
VQHRDATRVRHCLEQHFNSLAGQAFSEVAQTGEVAAGMGQTLREAVAHRIIDHRHNDRDGTGGILHSADRIRAIAYDHRRFEVDEFGGKLRKAIIVATRRADIQQNVFPFDVAEFPEATSERIDTFLGA